MPDTPDPFTQSYDAIWRALLASDDWKALVKSGNRLDVTGDGKIRELVKGARAPADMAEVEIEPSRWLGSPFGGNSKIGTITQNYTLSLRTDAPAILKLNLLKWETYRALFRSGESLGLPQLVKDWNIANAMDTDRLPGPSQKTGYSTVIQIGVEMYVSRNSL